MINWISDVVAEKMLSQLGIGFTRKFLPVSSIDKKRSLQNTARLDVNLDEEHVQSITLGAADRDPIPAIVVWKTTSKNAVTYVVAGGNHRLEAMIRLGENMIDCYIVEVGESEFNVLCQMLNLANGKSVSDNDRVRYAIDAIDKGICKTQKEASQLFRVNANTLSSHISSRKAFQKLAARVNSNYKPHVRVAKILEKVVSDEVHKEAFDFVESSKKLNRDEVVDVLTSALSKPSEREQIVALQNAKLLNPERKIASSIRNDFLKLLRKLDLILDKHKTFSSMDIVDDKDAVKSQIEGVARKLRSL
jgi:dGTP triphosphohydrolase